MKMKTTIIQLLLLLAGSPLKIFGQQLLEHMTNNADLSQYLQEDLIEVSLIENHARPIINSHEKVKFQSTDMNSKNQLGEEMQKFQTVQRRLSDEENIAGSSGHRNLYHIPMLSSPLYGNSTHFQYFYVPLQIGTHQHPQGLIVDTGSSITALPCKPYCHSDQYTGHSTCGHHIHELYNPESSSAHHPISCKTDSQCKCTGDGNDNCEFEQGYVEGSSYEGVVVSDRVWFGQKTDAELGFDYIFGCIGKETNLFYTQRADGILGMGKGQGMLASAQVPIWKAMYDQQIVEMSIFSLCLGKNGGFMQIGGYNLDQSQPNQLSWYEDLKIDQTYMFTVEGVSLNGEQLLGSDEVKAAFVDSGTTFSYLPKLMWESLMYQFDNFCEHTKDIKDKDGHRLHCPSERFMTRSQGELVMCFNFDKSLYGPDKKFTTKEFLLSYPVIKFHVKDTDGKESPLLWYPSEYLYLDQFGKMYCLAADKQNDPTRVLLGSTFMRQNQFIFDNQNGRIGIVRANCSKNEDGLTISGPQDYQAAGRAQSVKSIVAGASGLAASEPEGQIDNKTNDKNLPVDPSQTPEINRRKTSNQQVLTTEQFEDKLSERQDNQLEGNTDQSLTYFTIFCISAAVLVIIGFMITLCYKKSYKALRSDDGQNDTTSQGQSHLKSTEITEYSQSDKKQYKIKQKGNRSQQQITDPYNAVEKGCNKNLQLQSSSGRNFSSSTTLNENDV